MREHTIILEGILQNETVSYTLTELCEICVIEPVMLEKMIEFGIIEPKERLPSIHFDYRSLNRVKKALRLQRDLAINWEGISLVLDLLDEIDALHVQISERTIR